jgi:predicted RNA-binding Zn ribbon-like protein
MSDAASSSPQPFKFIGGHLALDLVNTVDWTDQGLALERLSSYPRLLAWAEGAGVLGKSEAGALRRRAALEPSDAARALGLAHRVRAAIQACAGALSQGEDPGPALGQLDALLPRALGHLRLETDRAAGKPGVHVGWEGFGVALDSPLWPVLWSAVQLFTSPESGRVRLCSGRPAAGPMSTTAAMGSAAGARCRPVERRPRTGGAGDGPASRGRALRGVEQITLSAKLSS